MHVSFVDDAAYEPLLVLLALITSSPELPEPMACSLLASNEPNLPSFFSSLDAADDSSRGWIALRDDQSRCPCSSLTPEAIQKWLPVVSRLSFQPGLAQLGM